MQSFLNYAIQPSNKDDFWSIFDADAKFKYQRPGELQRKSFFEEQFSIQIMRPFYHHLKKNKLIPEATEEEKASKKQNLNICHDDFVFAFSTWLEQEDTIFVYLEKPKQEPKNTHHYNNQNAAPASTSAQHKYPSGAGSASKQQHSVPEVKKEAHQKQVPFLLQKMGPGQHVVPTAATKQAQTHQPKPVYHHQPQVHHPPPLFTQFHDDKPFKERFWIKLADYLEYPQRAVSIKSDLNVMLQQQKKG